ncbi:MAG TPA: hypothetical protein VHW91_03865 [Candidatus Dormibacteraeota bacterium]|jgi:hypothetical protein|nr:hypothetical protein [Candidatus Dormibacteraeota bacterium]
MIKRPVLSTALAVGATLILAVNAAASTTYKYTEWIHGSELPNATTTEGQFVGEATGSFNGAWYIDVRHDPLYYSTVYITGGSFSLSTVVNGWPGDIEGSFDWHGGTVKQISGFSGCTNQQYRVNGALSHVGVDGGSGTGYFSATLTHYRTNVWLVGCVVYSASVSGNVWLNF